MWGWEQLNATDTVGIWSRPGRVAATLGYRVLNQLDQLQSSRPGLIKRFSVEASAKPGAPVRAIVDAVGLWRQASMRPASTRLVLVGVA